MPSVSHRQWIWKGTSERPGRQMRGFALYALQQPRLQGKTLDVSRRANKAVHFAVAVDQDYEREAPPQDPLAPIIGPKPGIESVLLACLALHSFSSM